MGVDELSREFLKVLLRFGGEADTSTIRTETGMKKSQVHYRFEKLSDKGWIMVDRADEGKGDRDPPKVAILTDEGRQSIKNGDAGGELLEFVSGDGGSTSDSDSEETVSEDEVVVSKTEFVKLHEKIDRVSTKVNGLLDRVPPEDEMVRQSELEEFVSGSDSEGSSGMDDGDAQDNSSGTGIDEDELVDPDEFTSLRQQVGSLESTVEMMSDSMSQKAPLGVMDKVEGLEADVDEVSAEVTELDEQVEFLYQWVELAELYMKTTRYLFEVQGIDFEAGMEDVESGAFDSDGNRSF